MFLENEFDDEDQTIGKIKQHSNTLIDNDKETIIDVDNKKNCNKDDGDKNNQQSLKNNSCMEQPVDFLIKDEVDIEETYLKIENNFNDEDQEIYENNQHRSIPVDDDDDDDDNDKTIININQISDKKDTDRYCFNFIEDGSGNEELPSLIGSDSEDEDNQPLSTLIGVNKKIRNNINVDGNLHDNNSFNITANESNNDKFCSTVVAACDEIQGHHKNYRFSNKPLDDVENKTIGNKSNSDKNNTDIIVLNVQQTSRKLHQCFICKKNFTNDSNLTKHLLRHIKRYKCNTCGKKFIKNSSLTDHSLIHTDEKSYQCYICGKRFTQSTGLNKHLKMHTTERAYQCDICNKRFIRKGDLKSHLLKHTGEKLHQCSICNMRFLRKAHLKTHLVIHSGEKPHQCSICDKKFPFKYSLKHHLRVHTGEKPYQCDICYKRFIQKSNLKTHLKVHKGQKTSKV